MTTVPQLLAKAHGVTCEGKHRCFYCGAPADEHFPTREHVLDTFTGHSDVACPGSQWICAGCVLCLREATDISMIDGTTRTVTKAAMRAFSWLITSKQAVAISKTHASQLRQACLNPPPAPWAISIATSGQKHVLYRGQVNLDNIHERVISLEGEPIRYHADDLPPAIAMCERIASVVGKMALAEPPTWSQRFAFQVLGSEEASRLITWWEREAQTPLGRLAAYLCPSKKEQSGE